MFAMLKKIWADKGTQSIVDIAIFCMLMNVAYKLSYNDPQLHTLIRDLSSQIEQLVASVVGLVVIVTMVYGAYLALRTGFIKEPEKKESPKKKKKKEEEDEDDDDEEE